MNRVTTSDRVKRNAAGLCVAGTAVLAAKLTTLALPYYWDEMEWAAGAIWLSQRSVMHALPGWYPPATFLGHPPAMHVLLSLLFKLFGQSTTVAHLLAGAFSALGLFFAFKLGRLLYGSVAGIVAALFLLAMPVYFAQSGMFLGDVPVAALGTGCVYFALQDRYRAYAIGAVPLVLIKEPAAAVITAITIYKLITTKGDYRTRLGVACLYAAPLLVLCAFLVVQRLTTGSWVFINDSPVGLFETSVNSVGHRIRTISQWVFIDQSRFLLVVLTVLGAVVVPRSYWRRALLLFAMITIMGAYPYAVIYYLPRYVMPVFPFLCIAAAGGLSESVRFLVPAQGRLSAAITLASAIGLAAVMHQSPADKSESNYEWNMGYRNVIRVYQAAYAALERQLDQESNEPCVLTLWPHNVTLTRPELGYVRRPFPVATFRRDAPPAEPPCNLILWSEPADSSKIALREYARQHQYTLRERIVDGTIVTELYQRTSGNSPG